MVMRLISLLPLAPPTLRLMLALCSICAILPSASFAPLVVSGPVT